VLELQNLCLIAGLGLMLFVCARYARRTQELRSVVLFWERRLVLTRQETHLQRAGVLLLSLGVALRYLMVLQGL